MEIFDNINTIVKTDLEAFIEKGSRLSIAAACDSSFADSPSKINVEEIFKLLAPGTTVKVI